MIGGIVNRFPPLVATLPSRRTPAKGNAFRNVFRCSAAAQTSGTGASVAEQEANQKRWEESGHQGSVDEWKWTLNWDDITDRILVGSCPRSVEDVETLMREANVDAFLCLQSDGCFDALEIDYEGMRAHGCSLGAVMTRVAVWDFNRDDQALMLPEAIRKLAVLVALGKRVYVHCTAGINRATLTVVGYLTFVEGWQRDDAVDLVKRKRSQAHPYMECWKMVRQRLTEGRTDEVLRTATRLYEDRCSDGSGCDSDGFADWVAAEGMLIRDLFQRQLQADLSLIQSVHDVGFAQRQDDTQVCMSETEFGDIQAEMGLLRTRLDDERAQCRAALMQVSLKTEENRRLREARPDVAALLEDQDAKIERLKQAEVEISALKTAIRDVAISAYQAVRGKEVTLLDQSAKSAAASPVDVKPVMVER